MLSKIRDIDELKIKKWFVICMITMTVIILAGQGISESLTEPAGSIIEVNKNDY